MPDELRVGFLGTGGIAKAHAENIVAMDNVHVVAAYSRHTDHAASFLKEYSIDSTAHGSFEEMLEKTPLDALIVAIPPGAHDGQVELAAASGIHLFLEKPIALTVERARSQVHAVEAAGVVAMVGYMNRFGSAIVKLKELIDRGEAGRPTLFQGRYFCNNLHSDWWRDRAMAGGQIVEQIIHTFDLALHLFGDVSEVCAFTDNLCHRGVDGYSVEDTSVTLLRFENGALATIAGSNCAVPGKWTNDFRVVCENVTSEFADSGHADFRYANRPEVPEVVADDTQILAEEIRVFLDCVRSGEPSPVAIRDGFKGVALTAAIALSADSGGRPVQPESL